MVMNELDDEDEPDEDDEDPEPEPELPEPELELEDAEDPLPLMVWPTDPLTAVMVPAKGAVRVVSATVLASWVTADWAWVRAA